MVDINNGIRVGLHPLLLEKVDRVLNAMAALGWPMKIVQGVRTAEQQGKLYAQGRTAPGKVVTNADGVVKKSNHQPKQDGYGYAVDCAFVDNPATPVDETWSDRSPWSAYGACAKAVGLVWGGDWKSLPDRPHVELPGLPPSKGT